MKLSETWQKKQNATTNYFCGSRVRDINVNSTMFRLLAFPPQFCPLPHSLNTKLLQLFIREKFDRWYKYLYEVDNLTTIKTCNILLI